MQEPYERYRYHLRWLQNLQLIPGMVLHRVLFLELLLMNWLHKEVIVHIDIPSSSVPLNSVNDFPGNEFCLLLYKLSKSPFSPSALKYLVNKAFARTTLTGRWV